MRITLSLAVLGAAMAATPSASAHHSPVMVDQGKTITLEGTVRQFQWTNPHWYIQLVDGGYAMMMLSLTPSSSSSRPTAPLS